jgi:uncharacterized coiled-coil protein SlyX
VSSDDLAARLEALERQVAAHERRLDDTDPDESSRSTSRRSVLRTLGLVGIGSYAVGTAGGDPQGQIGTETDPLRVLHTAALAGGVTGGTPLTDLRGAGLTIEEGALEAAVTGAANRGSGAAVFTGDDDGTLGFRSFVAGNNVSIDPRDGELVVTASDSNTNNDGTNLGTGAGLYAGRSGSTLEFRSLVAGTNVTLSGTDEEVTIDASSANMIERDADGLLEPTDGYTGIDVTDVRTTALRDRDGTAHLTLNAGGALGLDRPLDTNGNVIRSNTSVSVDVDADGDATGEQFSVTHDGGTPLLTVDEDGLVTVAAGSLRIDGGNAVQDGNGNDHLLFTPGGPLTLNQPLQTQAQPIRSDPGRELVFETDIDKRTLFLGPPATDSEGNTAGGHVLAGHPNNEVVSGVGAVISGGGDDTNVNQVDGEYTTIGGGRGNTASGRFATVAGGSATTVSAESATSGGGYGHTVSGQDATVAGGSLNEATDTAATIGGGFDNVASGTESTIAGGRTNEASGNKGIVPGGENNVAAGAFSFAAGRMAKTETSGGTAHTGAFVWGDSSSTVVRSDASDQVIFQAGGTRTSGTAVEMYSQSDGSAGVRLDANDGTWQSLSSRAAKADVDPVDPTDVLETVTDLPVSTWRYDGQAEEIRHMGPMAEDFHEAFGLGTSEETIAALDTAGVALAAIKGLSDRLAEKEDRIDDLEGELADCEEEIGDLEADRAALEDELAEKDERIEALEDRIDRIESAVGLDD